MRMAFDPVRTQTRKLWILVMFLSLASVVDADDRRGPGENPYPGRFPAPSLDGGVEWLNTSSEISLRDLRGKIVLLDFWTYCCINCIHILPDLKFLEQKYPNELVVIGVHAAKFENEKLTENIRNAILRYEIEHPVVNDAEMTIARKYAFSSWPTLVLIDPEGNFVGRVTGEGNGELMDRVIGEMIAYHKAKGTLDETPLRFDLERHRQESGPLKYPGKVLADVANQRLFISDSNHNRIVIAGFDGQLIDVIGTGAIGRKDGGYAEAEFDHPQGMALVDETLYVADTENHMIRTVDLTNKQVQTLSGTGEQSRARTTGGGLGMALNSPWDLTYLNGYLYIAMAGPHQLWRHKLGTRRIEHFAGSGREDIIDGDLQSCALAQPSGITHDGTNLYFVDSEGSAVRQVSGSGRRMVTTLVGPHDLPRGASLFAFDDIDGVGDAVRLQHPLGIVHHEGVLFVADSYNHKIKRIDIQARTSETWLGTGETGNGLMPLQLDEPAGLTIAGDRMWIADTNNHRLLSVDLTTKEASEFIVEGLTPPSPPRMTPRDPAEGLPAEEMPPLAARVGAPLNVVLQFSFPPEFKLNPLSKVEWKLSPVGESGVVSADLVSRTQESDGSETEVHLEWPIAAAGEGVYELTVTYQYCREGAGGVCRLGRAKFRLPIKADAENEASPALLSIKP